MTDIADRATRWVVLVVVALIAGCQSMDKASEAVSSVGRDLVNLPTDLSRAMLGLDDGRSGATSPERRSLARVTAASENASFFEINSGFYIFQGLLREPYSIDWMLERSPYLAGARNEFRRAAVRRDVTEILTSNIAGHRERPAVVFSLDAELGEYDFGRRGFPARFVDLEPVTEVAVADRPWLDAERLVIQMNLAGLDKVGFLPMSAPDAERLIEKLDVRRGGRRIGVVLVGIKQSARAGDFRFGNYRAIGSLDIRVTKAIFHLGDDPDQVVHTLTLTGRTS